MVGGSRDDPATLVRFQRFTHATFTMVSLPEAVIQRYHAGVVFDGKTYADRISFLIDRAGKIVWTLRDPSPLAHVSGALAFLRKARG